MGGFAVLTLGVMLGAAALAEAADEGLPKLSAQEAARELANPNTPLANLTLRSQFRAFDGDLPSAGDQESFTLLFQPRHGASRLS